MFEHAFRAMGSPCALRVEGASRAACERIARAAADEVLRIERKYSRYRGDSVVSAINRSAGDARGVAVDDETAALLDYAQTAFEHSGGRFDPTSGVLREAWDFRSGRLPDAARVAALRARIGWQRVAWRRPRIALGAGMQLDFGGFGKEYAADRAAELARALGAESGWVDLGGDVAIVGPQCDGSPWRIGVRDPRPGPRAEAAASVALASGAIATSGDYQRAMVVAGRRYSHLLDPRTGWPVEGGPASVSALAPQCLVAGTAATIAMLHGAGAARWLEGLGLPWLCIEHDGAISGSVDTPSSAARPARATPAPAP